MQHYVIMSDYTSEGWKIIGETGDFQEAVKIREQGLKQCYDTVIFSPVKLVVTEGEIV